MINKGIVREVNEKIIKIEIFEDNNESCIGCHLNNYCSKNNNDKLITIPLINKSIKENDIVFIEIKESYTILTAFFLFILPLILFILMYLFIKIFFSEIISIILGLIFVFIYYVILKFSEQYIISKIINITKKDIYHEE